METRRNYERKTRRCGKEEKGRGQKGLWESHRAGLGCGNKVP